MRSSETLFIIFENYWNKKNHCTIKKNLLFAVSSLAECYTGPNRGTLLECLCAYSRLISMGSFGSSSVAN